MSRTDQEFKAEVLRRSEEYLRRRRERRKKLRKTMLCVVLIMGGMYLVSPFLATGGSTEPMENDMAEAPMSAEGSAGAICAPGAAAEYSFTADMEEVLECQKPPLMVMIDGVIYLDTGVSSEDVRKCGTFDGEITSAVSASEIPTEDDQSNFGVGYGYQFSAEEDGVEIYMNGKWWIFTAEEVGEEIPSTP